MNCSLLDKIWDYSNNKLPDNEYKAVSEQIASCHECKKLYNDIKIWNNDRVNDNQYLASKILNKIQPSERFYNKKSKLVTTYAYGFSILFGAVIGISIIAFNNKSEIELSNNKALSYTDQLAQYKADTYINELKNSEAENILIDINK